MSLHPRERVAPALVSKGSLSKALAIGVPGGEYAGNGNSSVLESKLKEEETLNSIELTTLLDSFTGYKDVNNAVVLIKKALDKLNLTPLTRENVKKKLHELVNGKDNADKLLEDSYDVLDYAVRVLKKRKMRNKPINLQALEKELKKFSPEVQEAVDVIKRALETLEDKEPTRGQVEDKVAIMVAGNADLQNMQPRPELVLGSALLKMQRESS